LTITLDPFDNDPTLKQFRNLTINFQRQGWLAIDENNNPLTINGTFEKISEVTPTLQYKILGDGEYTLWINAYHVSPGGGFWDWFVGNHVTFHVKNFKPVINSITSDPVSPFVGQTTTITSSNTNFVNSVLWNYGDI
jgi:hypothetical protein